MPQVHVSSSSAWLRRPPIVVAGEVLEKDLANRINAVRAALIEEITNPSLLGSRSRDHHDVPRPVIRAWAEGRLMSPLEPGIRLTAAEAQTVEELCYYAYSGRCGEEPARLAYALKFGEKAAEGAFVIASTGIGGLPPVPEKEPGRGESLPQISLSGSRLTPLEGELGHIIKLPGGLEKPE